MNRSFVYVAYVAALMLSLAITPSALAQATPPPEAASSAAEGQKVATWVRNLKFETGSVSLADGLATAQVPADFKYLNPADSKKLLTVFGNPPADNLGIIFPKEADLLTGKGSKWFVVLEYSDDGHVKDDEAQKIDYTKLLKDMQAGVKEGNAERTKQGYPSVEIVGWAEQPRYDETAHKLYWAKEIQFGGEPEHTLNYNIRVLGRTGVLVLNAVSAMDELPAIQKATPEILQMVDFNPGKRYADYQPSSDKLATYGIAALVAGGVAAKAGLFKTFLVGILALKKFLIIGAIAVVAFFKKLVSGSPRKPQE